MKITVSYDKEADAIYLYLSHKKISRSQELDSERIIDFSEDGEVRGIELLSVGNGVNTSSLPYRNEIERALNDKGIKTFA